jgi:succinate dehydrogenase / fumarate reductase, iron-sulfur subunit
MYKFKDGDKIVIEPWRSRAFPIIKDLIVDRTAFDKIMQAGGFHFGQCRRRSRRQRHADSNAKIRRRLRCSHCVGCGACVAACKNSSAMLFVSAKVSQFALQGVQATSFFFT